MATNDLQRIHFHYIDTQFGFPNRTKLKFFLLERLKKEKRVVDAINYIFCTDQYLLVLNQSHLNHDTLTDIITFELSPKGAPLLADVYISIERVKENAQLYGASFQKELHRVIFHGMLHLSGYGDKSASQAKVMRLKEDECLDKYFRST